MFLPLDSIWTPDPVVRSHPLARGLVAWWLAVPPLDGGRQWLDLLGLYPGTLSGSGVSWGRGGPADGGSRPLTFTGTGSVATAAPAARTLTWSAWFRLASAAGGYQSILVAEGGGNFLLLDCFGSRLAAFASDGTGLNDTSVGITGLAGGTWYHLALTRAGDGLGAGYQAYLNGLPTGSAATGTWTLPTGGITIGLRPGSGQGWVGDLADLQVRSAALSAAEVRALYDEGRVGYPNLLRRMPAFTHLLGRSVVSISFALAATVAGLTPALALSPAAPAPASLALVATAGPQSCSGSLTTTVPASATVALAAAAGAATASFSLTTAAPPARALTVAATAGAATASFSLTTPLFVLPTYLGLGFEPIAAYAGLDLDLSTFEDLT